ncbi:hypothetical protein ES703_33676 [subsurface metagenome]
MSKHYSSLLASELRFPEYNLSVNSLGKERQHQFSILLG